MYEHKLLISQRNAVLEAIKEHGLDPFNFRWATNESVNAAKTIVPILKYGDGEYYFQFDVKNKKQYALFSPGYSSLNMEIYSVSWEQQFIYVEDWLSNIKREIVQPDLWQELEKYRVAEEQGLLSDIENDSFTAKQTEQIQIGLLKVRSYLETFTKDNAEKHQFVSKQLDYLVEASKRQGKKDWLHTSIGVIVTLTTALTLAPEEAKNIWDILKAAVAGILQLPH